MKYIPALVFMFLAGFALPVAGIAVLHHWAQGKEEWCDDEHNGWCKAPRAALLNYLAGGRMVILNTDITVMPIKLAKIIFNSSYGVIDQLDIHSSSILLFKQSKPLAYKCQPKEQEKCI